MVTFRVMEDNDVDQLIKLDRYIGKEDPDVVEIIDSDEYKHTFQSHPITSNQNNDIILCFDNNDIIGRIDMMYETSYIDFSNVGYIDWIYVRKLYRNQGIGKKLLLEAEKLFKEAGCFKYYLFVADNEQAQAFYKTSGLDIKTMKTAQKIFNKGT
jgi:ribosomal protein S18 acetylase RimI-like enzyme